MNLLEQRLDENGTWLCQHRERAGMLAPSTHLRRPAPGKAIPTGFYSSNAEGIRCPKCGTLWRVWPDSRIAKPEIKWPPIPLGQSPPESLRANLNDIDRL